MFTKNMGPTDRALRAAVAAVLVAVYFTATFSWSWVLVLVAAVLAGTAALGSCPPYALLGINTCKKG